MGVVKNVLNRMSGNDNSHPSSSAPPSLSLNPSVFPTIPPSVAMDPSSKIHANDQTQTQTQTHTQTPTQTQIQTQTRMNTISPRTSSLEYEPRNAPNPSRSSVLVSSTGLTLDSQVEQANPVIPNTGAGAGAELRKDKLTPVCDHEHHLKRAAEVGEMKQGQPVSHRHMHLKPVIHETHYHHETEEITKHVMHERHTHTYHIREQPILRPRKIVTRARIVVETEVLPDLAVGDVPWSEERLAQWQGEQPMVTSGGKKDSCQEEGAYQEYAQAVHDRAVMMLTAEVSKTMRVFNRSLEESPIPVHTNVTSHKRTIHSPTGPQAKVTAKTGNV